MDGTLQSTATFDIVTGTVSAALYLIVGAAAYSHAPKDARARTFFTIAIAGLAPYLLPAVMGWIGTGSIMGVAVVVTALSIAVGAVALLHFAQVFPSRRPWIGSHGPWLAAAYGVLPLAAVIGVLAALPLVRVMADMSSQVAAAGGAGGGGAFGSAGAIDIVQALVVLAFLLPTLVVVGIVVPFAALLSLYRSWQDAGRDGRRGARVTTLWILISQLAGGVLTILIVPLLHLVAPNGPWVTIAAALLFGFGLLMPIAFAASVWKYRLLD